MDFIRPIGSVNGEAITPSGVQPAVTKNTTNRGLSRIAVEIQASGGTVYVGGPDVTAEEGLAIKDGESRVFPTTSYYSLYITGGKAIVVDYYG